jgi:hypothetical protein
MDLSRFLDPQVDDRLLRHLGEGKVREVHRHWVTRVPPALRIVAAMLLLAAMPLMGHLWWIGILLGLLVGLQGFYRMHVEFMDRFVITNKRVFRLHGVVDQHMGIVPLSRILDISLHRTFLGQVFGYGHFIFENAAQEQGLREIKFVGDPDGVNRTIQETLMRAGVGGSFELADEDEDTLSIS